MSKMNTNHKDTILSFFNACRDGDFHTAQKLLWEDGNILNVKDCYGNTGLTIASNFQARTELYTMITYSIRDNAMFLKACNDGDVDLVKAYLRYRHTLVNVCDKFCNTGLIIACARNHLDIADLNATNCKGQNALIIACYQGHLRIVKMLVHRGCNIHIRCKRSGNSLLHMIGSNVKILHFLIGRGLDVNDRNFNGATPLHFAVEHKSIDIIKALISYGANVRAETHCGSTMLHSLCGRSKDSHLSIAKLLLKGGADLNSCHIDGATPLHYACWMRNKALAEYFIKRGASIEARTIKGGKPIDYAFARSNSRESYVLSIFPIFPESQVSDLLKYLGPDYCDDDYEDFRCYDDWYDYDSREYGNTNSDDDDDDDCELIDYGYRDIHTGSFRRLMLIRQYDEASDFVHSEHSSMNWCMCHFCESGIAHSFDFNQEYYKHEINVCKSRIYDLIRGRYSMRLGGLSEQELIEEYKMNIVRLRLRRAYIHFTSDF